MAKLAFTKLSLKPNNEITIIEFNEQAIEVKQYLPVEEKLELIANVLELSHDQNNFSNPVKVSIYTALEIIEKYCNITFTDKQKETPGKIYDLIIGNGLFEQIKQAIPQVEYDSLINGIETTIVSVYNYRNSIFGILEAVTADYSNLQLDANEIQQQLKDPANLGLIKDIVTKLG